MGRLLRRDVLGSLEAGRYAWCHALQPSLRSQSADAYTSDNSHLQDKIGHTQAGVRESLVQRVDTIAAEKESTRKEGEIKRLQKYLDRDFITENKSLKAELRTLKKQK